MMPRYDDIIIESIIQLHEEGSAMQNFTKDKRFFITAASLCFFLSVFVFPTALFAGSVKNWGCRVIDSNDFIGSRFTAIAAGAAHSLALKSDGSILGWGRSDFSQARPPAGNDFIAIAAGGWHSLAIKSDGSIVGWGSNTDWEGDYFG